jgi:ABC-type multidrug transport system permease subunit
MSANIAKIALQQEVVGKYIAQQNVGKEIGMRKTKEWNFDDNRKLQIKYIYFIVFFIIITLFVVVFNGCVNSNSYVKIGDKVCECQNDAMLRIEKGGSYECICDR